MAAKKKARPKKKAAKPRATVKTPYEYFVDEFPHLEMSTQDMQDRLNVLGVDGWQLLFVGQYSSTPNTIRVFFMRPA